MNLHDLILKFEAEFESFIALIRAHPAIAAEAPADFSPAAPAGVTPPVAQPSAPAAAVPVALPPGGNTTDPTAPGFEAPATVAPASETVAPTLDTSGDELDFETVRGQPIDLTEGVAKTIVNGPATIMVDVNQASGQPGAHNSYTVTVNGEPHFMANVQAQFQLPVSGPKVVVSVDSPGLQLEVQQG